MKTKKLFFIPILISALLAVFYTGCDDSGVAPSPGTQEGPKPNIQFVPLSTFVYHYSTISQNGQERDTTWQTIDVIQNQTTFDGKLCYPIVSTTIDSINPSNPPPIPPLQTLYVSYDTSTYILYQHGVKRLFDPSQTATWDIVADFSVPLGTSVFLFTINNLLGQNSLSADVYSTVQKDTIIQTYLPPVVSINTYKVAVVADIKLSGTPIGKAYLDYYVGYTPASNPSNPSGRINVKIYPINISGFPGADGLNQKIKTFNIP